MKYEKYCDRRMCIHNTKLCPVDGKPPRYCMKYKKLIDKVKFCYYKDFDGGWITPGGELIPSDFGAHDISAQRIIEEKYPVMYERLRDFDYKTETARRQFLVNKGWLLLTGNPQPGMGVPDGYFVVCKQWEKVTPQQHVLLKKLEKEEIKFRGHYELE